MNTPTEAPKYSLAPLPGDDWETRFTKQVVRNIAHYRDERNLTTEKLAAACNLVIGEPDKFKKTTLNGMFAGKRKSISITEILVFAHALNVPPIALVFPIATNEPVEMVTAHGLSYWIDSMGPNFFDGVSAPAHHFAANAGVSDDDDQEAEELALQFEAARKPLELVVRHGDLRRTLEDNHAHTLAMWNLGEWVRDEETDRVDPRTEQLVKFLVELRAQMRERGLRLPYLPFALSFIDVTPLRIPRMPFPNLTSESDLDLATWKAERMIENRGSSGTPTNPAK